MSILDFAERVLATAGEPLHYRVGEVLVALGFEEVTVTPLGGDGGVDVRGTLVVGEVVPIRMAVQAKRWKGNVGPRSSSRSAGASVRTSRA